MHVGGGIGKMRSGQAMVVCAFGWGKEFRLYHDYLYVGGKYYRLHELTSVSFTLRTVLGISSACLELHFKRKKLVLRGIADIEQARVAAQYLGSWCEAETTAPEERNVMKRAPSPVSDVRTESRPVQSIVKARSGSAETTPVPARQFKSPKGIFSPAFHEGVTRSVETPAWSPRGGRPERSTRAQQRWEYTCEGSDEDALPVISVPVRLGAGETAHYSANATLCGERIQETTRYTYPALDHGLLILTSKRIIYIGRKSQVVLDHTHLMHVSQLRGALAFEADHWEKRAIFELPQPQECAACIQAILRKRAVREEAPLRKDRSLEKNRVLARLKLEMENTERR
jgi:hypothetical protein